MAGKAKVGQSLCLALNVRRLRTLSVSIVATSSSALTKSPTFLFHCLRVPSVMDSAICGTLTTSFLRDVEEKYLEVKFCQMMTYIDLGAPKDLPLRRCFVGNGRSRHGSRHGAESTASDHEACYSTSSGSQCDEACGSHAALSDISRQHDMGRYSADEQVM